MRRDARQTTQFSRIAWVIAIGFVGVWLLGHAFWSHERMLAATQAYSTSVTSRALAIGDLLVDAGPAEEARLLEALSAPGFELRLSATAPPTPQAEWPHADELRDALHGHLAATDHLSAQISFPAERRRGRPDGTVTYVQAASPLADGRWLVIKAGSDAMTWGWNRFAFSWGSLGFFVILLAVLWTARRSVRHLPRFAAQAEQLGDNVDAAPMEERGPREVRRAVRAFNQMQSRIKAYVAERTTMLAAVSHDIRTLLTRLELRTEYIDDDAQRLKAVHDIRDMTHMLDDVLAYAGGREPDEQPTSVDLGSLLRSLVDDETDAGRRASFAGPDHVVVVGEARGLKRAFANLIGNAIRYGDVADVTLEASGGDVKVVVADEGPGIPESEHDHVLKPFYRLESSRSRETGGSGLGLSVVHAIVARHGGTLTFAFQGGRFAVTVALPAQS